MLPTPLEQSRPITDGDHLLPPHPDRAGKKSGAGPIVGIIIILVLVLFGALYFWGAALNGGNTNEQLPLIPGDTINS